MEIKNIWQALRDVLCLVLLLGFCVYILKAQIPVTAAQVGANEKLVQQLNQVLGDQNQKLETRFARIEGRLGLTADAPKK